MNCTRISSNKFSNSIATSLHQPGKHRSFCLVSQLYSNTRLFQAAMAQERWARGSQLFRTVKQKPMLLVELSTNKTENGFKGSVKTHLENRAKTIFRLRLGFTTESRVWIQPLTHRQQMPLWQSVPEKPSQMRNFRQARQLLAWAPKDSSLSPQLPVPHACIFCSVLQAQQQCSGCSLMLLYLSETCSWAFLILFYANTMKGKDS